MGALFSQQAKARTLGSLLLATAAVSALIVVFPHAVMVREAGSLILAGVSVAFGLAFIAAADRIGERELHLGVGLAIVLVGAANYYVGPVALFSISFTWLALFVFAFFGRREALGYMGLIAIAFAVVLTDQDVSSPVIRWLLGIGTPLVAGLLVSRVVRTAVESNKILADRERQTRTLIAAAPSSFFTLDEEGKVLQWNREAERTFGYTADEAVGQDSVDLIILPEDREGHIERRHRAFAMSPDAPAPRRELHLMRRDGARFMAEVTLSLVLVDERPLLLCFIRDLTDRIEREREREQLYREQTARREAEQMSTMVHGLQLLLDAALAHGRLEQMLEALLPRLCEVLSADVASIFLVEEDTEALVLRASSGGLPDEPVVADPEHHVSAQVRDTRAPTLINDPSQANLADPGMRGAASVIAVPLLAGDEVTGVILVGVFAPRRFDEDGLLLLGLAADRVALAIEHARVFEREHRIAEMLQRSLLPERLPHLPGLEVAARYLPAASEAEVGGDWYDVIPLDSSRVGLVMGDVVGKGLAAASMVGRLRSAMRAYALEGHEPAALMTRLNELVWSEVEESEMATMVYLVVDPAAGEVRWVNAGHPPPLVLGDDEPWFLEGGRAVPLGVMPFPSFEEAVAPIPGGHALLLFTDGLVERPGELLDDGFARLAAAVADADCGATALCDHVLGRLVPTGAMADDVALLALHMPQLTDSFSFDMSPDAGQLASMRALLRRWLKHSSTATETEIAEVLMATGEAAANAIEHANSGAVPFEVEGAVEADEVSITVRDHGTWRENNANGRGRGLVLMREFMDDVEVASTGEGTTVHMRRRVAARAPS